MKQSFWNTLAIMLILCLGIQTAFSQSIWNGNIDTDWYTSNTSAAEYTITTPQQLAGLEALVYNGYSFNGKTVKLGANIVLNNTAGWENWGNYPPANTWKPIGTSTDGFRFSGTFDGNGYTISGIYINNSDNYQGLFGYVSGTIKNIGVVNAYIKGGSYTGGLVGYGNGISNSYFNGKVIGTSYVGGLAGRSSTISNGYFNGNATGTDDVGGLVGSGSSIIGSYSTGTVTGTGYVGGLAGSISTIKVSYSTSTVNATGTSVYVGGLAGSGSTISNSYASGDVTGTGTNTYVGGLVGRNSGTISDSYYIGRVNGTGTGTNTYVGGLVGENSGTVSSCYSTSTVTGAGTNSGTGNTSISVYVGGLVGNNTNTSTSAVRFSYSTASVTGTGTNNNSNSNSNVSVYVGGLVGNNINTNVSAIRNNYSIGMVSGIKAGTYSSRVSVYAGGLVGDNSGGAISSSYYNIQTSGQNDNGKGDGKTTAELKQKSTYNLWNFDDTWDMSDAINNGYPYLRGIISEVWYNNESTIRTAKELADFAKIVNSGYDFEYKTVKLEANIFLNDTTNWQNWANNPPANRWTPIGTLTNSFKGIFDGNGFTVSGVYINNSDSYQGLFGSIGSGGTIKKLGVTASYIKGNVYSGVLAGLNNGGTIINSYSAGIVEGSMIGGLVGSNMTNSTISNSYSSVAISTESYGGGGLVGYNYGTINNSYSIGVVMGQGVTIGGLVGYNSNGIINNSYYDIQTSGQNDEGKGEGKTTAEMREKATFINWDFNAVWGINSTKNCGYPYLLGFEYSETNSRSCPSATTSPSSSSSSDHNPSSSSDDSSPIKIPKIASANKIQSVDNGVSLQVINNASLEIFSLNGNSLRKINFTNGVYFVKFSDLPKGIYIVKVKFGNSGKEIIKVPIR